MAACDLYARHRREGLALLAAGILMPPLGAALTLGGGLPSAVDWIVTTAGYCAVMLAAATLPSRRAPA